MFVIFDGEAQFTIDGRTSVLKAPAGAPTRAGSSHAIYNASDKPIQWMNINVGTGKRQVRRLQSGRRPRRRAARSDTGVHDDAAVPRPSAAGHCHERRQGYRAVPARLVARSLRRSLGVRGPHPAAARNLGRVPQACGSVRILLRHGGKGTVSIGTSGPARWWTDGGFAPPSSPAMPFP